MTPSDAELTVALVDSDVRDAERVTAMADDPYLWPEDISGQAALDWRDTQHPHGVWRRTTLEQTYEFTHPMLNNKRSQPGLSQ
jgi:prolyl oligopeptidase PreP (S9A serine peptidase family)